MARGKPFAKGNKAAKGGKRPRAGRKPDEYKATLAERLAELDGEEIDVIVKIMRDKKLPADVRLRAARDLADRKYGRAYEQREVTNQGTVVIEVVHPKSDAARRKKDGGDEDDQG